MLYVFFDKQINLCHIMHLYFLTFPVHLGIAISVSAEKLQIKLESGLRPDFFSPYGSYASLSQFLSVVCLSVVCLYPGLDQKGGK